MMSHSMSYRSILFQLKQLLLVHHLLKVNDHPNDHSVAFLTVTCAGYIVTQTEEQLAGALNSLSVSQAAAAAAEPVSNGGSSGGVVVEMGGSSGSGDSKVCHQCKQGIAGAFVVAKDWSFHPDCFTYVDHHLAHACIVTKEA